MAVVGFRRPEHLWGEGLVDQSYSSLLYGGTDWRAVTDDELVFLLPSLCRPQYSNELSETLSDRVGQRMSNVVKVLIQHPCFEQTTRCATLDLLRRSGAAGTFFEQETIETVQSRTRHRTVHSSIRDLLCRLATMDRMLYDCRPTRTHTPLIENCEISAILLSTIHTRINAAYVYPDWAYAHELLSMGAWLGTVVSGRAALLPVGVAETLIDYLERDPADMDQIERRVHNAITCYADLAGGRRQIFLAAQTTLNRGPQVFRPLRPASPALIEERDLWDPVLRAQIEEFLMAIELDLETGSK